MSEPRRALRIAFLDSWLQTAVDGSGTAVGINGLEQALCERGHVVERIAPAPNRLPITLRRLIFNLRLPRRLRRAAYDLVVGFDFDGVWLQEQRTENTGTREHGNNEQSASQEPRAKNQEPGTGNQNRYVCSIKGVIAEELQHERGRIRLLFTLLARLEGSNARRADRVLTTSEYCRQRIAAHYRVPDERIGIVPEGIDLQHWKSALAATPPRRDSRPTILCVARQYPRKHVADLIHAFALVRPWVPDARLRLVGDGPEHDRLIALVDALNLGSAVTFLGGIPDAEVKREYAHCDLFCLPSVQEGFGIVFLEAMAAGKPIVSTTAAAIPEVVRHGVTGILVPPGDVRSLAGALLLLLTDSDRRERYGRAAQQAVEDYDWSRVADRFLHEVAPLL